jgi:DNA-binding NarL/FixJ family response regulator
MSEISVLIVEDEPLIAADISEYLTNQDYRVSAVAYNLEDALKALEFECPDIALLDINLGGNMDGFTIAESINKLYFIPFIYLTSYSSKSILDEAKLTRPMGYIVKPFNGNDLYTSIEIAMYNFAQLQRPVNFNEKLINQKLLSPLTSKEFEILIDIYEGRTNKQMSDKHYISINTVKTHIQKIYEKLGVNSRTSTLAKARELMQS